MTTMADDWQLGKTLSDRLQHMLSHQLMCDVTFRVGSTQTPIKSHKFMLASASPVFYSMFEGPMAEKGDVSIPDVEAEVFNDILTYIYTDNIDVRTDNVYGLMYASDKYMLDVIKIECKKFLTANINEDYACVVLQIAHTFHLEDLQKDALQFIFSHGKACLESMSFLRLLSECVKLIIESDKLCCTEDIVYQTMIQWAKRHVTADDEQRVTGDKEQPVTGAEEQHMTDNDEQHETGNEKQHVTCNEDEYVIGNKEQRVTANDEQLRKVLGDLIYLIRFPIMEHTYFTNEVSTKNVLTLKEMVEIYQSMNGKLIVTFSDKMRLYELKVWRCESDVESNYWAHRGADDCLDFTTSFDCYINRIIVFGSTTYSGQHDVNITILNGSTLLVSTSTKLNSVPGKESYPIDLAEPLRIVQNITYTIKLNMKGEHCFRGKDYKTVVKISDDSCVTFTDSSSSLNATTSTTGQIPGIILSYFR